MSYLRYLCLFAHSGVRHILRLRKVSNQMEKRVFPIKFLLNKHFIVRSSYCLDNHFLPHDVGVADSLVFVVHCMSFFL
jgi:hypothetical protein